MIRETSLEAYEEIQRSGILSQRRWEAYNTLFQFGPMTASELVKKAGVSGLWKRLSELKKFGVAHEVGERKCEVTGMTALIWDITGNLPRKLTAQEKLIEQIANAEDKLIKLRAELAEIIT